MQKPLFSIRATYIALCLYIISTISIGAIHFNTRHLIDFVLPTSSGVFFILVLIYFHQAPQDRHSVAVKALLIMNAYAFIPPAWYFTISSTLNDWVFVDEFPPVSGLMLIVSAMSVVMAPQSWLKYMFLLWVLICAPILVYLIAHPTELQTARGKEMIVFFGPCGALLLIVLFYQRDLFSRFYQIEERLRYSRRQADYDELTDIYNRRGLIYWLSSNAGEKPNISSLIIDIDHFKQINDTHGHESGDAVLREAAKLLENSLPKQSCLARWGGDEFVVLLNDLTANQAKKVADTCWRAIHDHQFPLVGQLTCSIGVAHNIQSNDIDTLIRQADACLYIAKRQGRDQVVSRPSEE